MGRYHVNSETGEPGLCSASVRACPHGGAGDHYDSPQTARAAYEENQALLTLPEAETKAPATNLDRQLERITNLSTHRTDQLSSAMVGDKRDKKLHEEKIVILTALLRNRANLMASESLDAQEEEFRLRHAHVDAMLREQVLISALALAPKPGLLGRRAGSAKRQAISDALVAASEARAETFKVWMAQGDRHMGKIDY